MKTYSKAVAGVLMAVSLASPGLRAQDSNSVVIQQLQRRIEELERKVQELEQPNASAHRGL